MAKPTKKTASGTKATNKTKISPAEARRLAQEKSLLAANVTKGRLQGFIDFIREKGVVGLAIGLAIGTAASGLVTQIVAAVIKPILDLLIGKEGLSGWNVTLNIGDRSGTFLLGDLLDALIKFVAIAAVIYFVVMGLKLDKLDKKKD
jgi:large conductance mechanosensitive channel